MDTSKPASRQPEQRQKGQVAPHSGRSKSKPTSLEREPSRSLKERVRLLIAQMRESIWSKRASAKEPINLSIPPHVEITEALRYLVYEDGSSQEPEMLHIVYGDNTRGKPFPVHALWLPDGDPEWQEARAFNIGTLTFRHVDYDDYVDMYLIRDRETRTMTNAEIEDTAYTRMSDILRDPLLNDESYLAIYQTGLEPLVVGVYRALVEHLQHRRREGMPALTVQPVFFPGGSSRSKGTRWA